METESTRKTTTAAPAPTSDAIPDARASTVMVAGRRVRYHEAGEGPPVVLLHGGGLDRASLSWRHVLPALAGDRHVLAPDLPGYGGSEPLPTGEVTVPGYVSFLEGFLDAVAIESTALVGLSLGGGVALGFALDHPERVDRLVLVDSYGLGGTVPGGRLATTLMTARPVVRLTWWALRRSRRLTGLAVRGILGPGNATPDLVDEVYAVLQTPGAARPWIQLQRNEVAGGRLRTDYVDRLPDLAVPTLLVHGEADPLVPVEWAVRAGTLLPDAEVRLLPGCGHWPPREAPDKVTELVGAFLAP